MSKPQRVQKRMLAIIADTRELEEVLSSALLSATQPKEFADLYIQAAALQFRSHFRAAHVLLQTGFEAEAWILIRSMTELLVRMKWAKRNKSNAVWIFVGTELKELNRFKSQRDRSRLKTAAVHSIEKQLDEIKPQIPRNARCWNRSKPAEFRALPSAKTMAKECGLLKVYWTWFKLGSGHTHSSPRTLERFMATDENGEFTHWILDPPSVSLSETCRRLNCLSVGFLGYLQKFGWPVEKARLERIAAAVTPDRSKV